MEVSAIVTGHRSARIVLAAVFALSALGEGAQAQQAEAPNHAAPAGTDEVFHPVIDYVGRRNATGFIVMRRGTVLVERYWPAPTDPTFAFFVHGRTRDGRLLEDVASQQKSFVAVLVAIAADKGLIDVERPVSAYIGAGWSKALPAQEAKIRVIDLLTMSSGLDEKFGYAAPPGTQFHYNTPVYAITQRVLEAAAGQPLDALTRDWLTVPAGMTDTGWRRRPAALGNVGNAVGLVTTARDIARFGQMVLSGGVAPGGPRLVSAARLRAMFEPSIANPAYGQLWWLNGAEFSVDADGRRSSGPLNPFAPSDLVAALGFLDRKLYVVPSLDLVVVRTGAAASDSDFDAALWRLLLPAVHSSSVGVQRSAPP